MTRFDERLADTDVLILDGGLGTQLEACGCDVSDPLWSARVLLDQPERLLAVHRAFVEAGADIIVTATYQATFEALAARGLDRRQAEMLFVRAVELARQAASPSTLVGGSLGSYGATLGGGGEYRGGFGRSKQELVDTHAPRFELLAPHVDVVAFETIPDPLEAEAIAEVTASHDVATWVSFTCRDETHIAHGEPLRDVIAPLLDVPNVRALGVNCTAPHLIAGLLDAFAGCTQAIVVYPNGERFDDGWCGETTSPEQLATLAETWASRGARIIGGCCRTTPAHIRALRNWADAR